MARRALGKGLSSLIKVDESGKKASPDRTYPKELSIGDIKVNKEQPRKIFAEDKLEELAASIKQLGVLEPIIVQKKQKHYVIVAGERRYRAAIKAGLKKIPAIQKNNLTDEEVMQVALIENLQREDINPLDAAFAFQKLIDKFKYTHEELSRKISKDRSTITNFLRLLELPELIQEDLRNQKMTLTQARPLLGLKNEKDILKIREAILQDSFSVRKIEKLVKEKKGQGKAQKKDVFLEKAERDLMSAFKTKVMIQDKKGKGKVEIEYYSYEDLERIINRVQ